MPQYTLAVCGSYISHSQVETDIVDIFDTNIMQHTLIFVTLAWITNKGVCCSNTLVEKNMFPLMGICMLNIISYIRDDVIESHGFLYAITDAG